MKDKLINTQSEVEAALNGKSGEILVEQGVSDQPDMKKADAPESATEQALEKELNGPKGLEPTRYGDWESKGRCYDF